MQKRENFRVNKLVKAKYPTLSQAQIEEALDYGLILSAAGKKLQKGLRVESDDFDYSKLEAQLAKLAKGNPDLRFVVIDETENEWIIDKPAGIPGHPIHLSDFETVTHWAFAKMPELVSEFSEIQPTLTPHRLDTGTSGLLVVCKNKTSFENWRKLFSEKKVEKKYIAKCWNDTGTLLKVGQTFHVEKGLAHHPSDARKMVLASELHRPPVLLAESEFKVLKVEGEKVTLEVQTHSGVTHQVRVHALSLGLPLIGDSLYDPQFEKRLEKPNYHYLRAVYLKPREGKPYLCVD